MNVSLLRFKIKLANKYPLLAKASRFYKACLYHLAPRRPSYAQHGEDTFIWEKLNRQFPGSKFNYLDVGGFHPMLLSNTYLLYRNKVRGVVIEPNPDLLNLHKIFRSGDIQLPIACSRDNSLGQFYLQTTFPALSSLKKEEIHGKAQRRYVPLLNLDTIVAGLELTRIYFLSIDVEGFDLEVLQGAEKTLQKTFLICIEFNSPEEQNAMSELLSKQHFSLLKRFDCNLIFQNEKFGQTITMHE